MKQMTDDVLAALASDSADEILKITGLEEPGEDEALWQRLFIIIFDKFEPYSNGYRNHN